LEKLQSFHTSCFGAARYDKLGGESRVGSTCLGAVPAGQNMERKRIIMTIRILHDYHSLGEAALAERGLSIAAQMILATFTVTSTVTAAVLKAKAQSLVDSIAVCQTGTTQDTLNKSKIIKELLALLDILCNDVENAANAAGNPAIVPAFGFTLASGTRTSAVPGPTAILNATNPGTGKIGLELLHDSAAWCYLVEDTLLPNGPTKTYTFTDPDNVVLVNLTSGSMHSLRACTMVAKNQTGPWCEPVQHMST
jgi:hypothetical protein